MKKTFHILSSTIVLAALITSQLPSRAQCQMLSGSLMAKACSMACCKANMPVSQCPLIKAETPRDVIASSVQDFKNTLQPLHHVPAITVTIWRHVSTHFVDAKLILQRLFPRPAAPVRAPPSDIHTTAA